MNKIVLAIATTGILFTGCARYTYNTTHPTTQLKHTKEINATIDVDRNRRGLILTIHNNTDEDLELNWNKTVFIEDGKTAGKFMFNGVVFSKRNETKANDIIFAGGNFEKNIYPNSKVYLIKGWGHSIIGYGVVGASLYIESESGNFREKVLVDRERTEIKE